MFKDKKKIVGDAGLSRIFLNIWISLDLQKLNEISRKIFNKTFHAFPHNSNKKT